MSIKMFYLIDRNISMMIGEYNQYGRLCSRVMIGNESLLVERTPLQLMDDTLKYISFNLNGAYKGAKEILGDRKFCPVIVNPYQDVCLFPIKATQKDDCMWFNPQHIVKTKRVGNGTKTEVELSNGISIIVDLKLASFNNKLQTALQLWKLSKDRGTTLNPMTSHFEPKKGHQLNKLKNGKYNFDALNKKQG
jgi:competence protein ComK